ncbi:MAG: outer membrane integrity protein, partial [Bacteroidetes bacterium]|nr:outer membrane integrity protein [Bacteroidota bacterium]
IPADTGNINIKLNEYRLNNARIVYEDATLPMKAEIIGLNHSGSGNFTLDVYDLVTKTSAEKLTVVYDGVKYLNKIKLDADVEMKIDMEKDLRIDLKNNLIAINDLQVALEGWVAMPGDNIDMNLVYKAQNTSFKSILSLVPGIYTESFADVKTDGSLAFDGGVKGTYNETQLPGFFVNLNVANATVQYPDVPKPITGINMDMKVNNEDGNLENTIIDIQALHADFGSNPIDAKVWVKGLENIQVKGHVNANLNLDEVMAMYPVEGTDLKGKFKLDATADGTYNEARGTFPKVNAVMDMTEGYVKNAEYPAELTKLNFHATLLNEDGSLEKSIFDIPNFSFLLDGEPIEGKAHVENFDNPHYQVNASGSLDLEKLMQIYPIDSMTLKGRMIVDQFATSGKYSDIEAENYTNLASSGTIEIQNLEYTDYYLPHPVTVESGKASFTPSRLEFTDAKGKLGSSDYQVSGYFSNYMAYALMDNQKLKGKMTLNSRKMDLNEWMEEEESTATSGANSEESELEVFPVPDNLDIELDANIGQVIYDDL